MCGIFCSILYNQSPFLNQLAKRGSLKQSNLQFAKCCDAILKRGPDHYQELHKDISPCTILQCAASILWMQGLNPVPQPFCDDDGNILLWNGDIYNGPLVLQHPITFEISARSFNFLCGPLGKSNKASEENDTKTLAERLLNATRRDSDILEVFTEIRGPYSFIYYQNNTKTLYFGRDVVGRHSLLIGYTQRNITITSVASRSLEGFIEVPAVGIFQLKLEKDGEVSSTLYPWSHNPEEVLSESTLLPRQLLDKFQIGRKLKSYVLIPNRRNKLPTREELEMWATSDPNLSVSQLMDKLSMSDSKSRIQNAMTLLSSKPSVEVLIEDLLNTLRESVRCRLEKRPNLCKACVEAFVKGDELKNACSHAKLGVLFSGGLDSSILAAIAHSLLPIDEPIDLLNVAFEKAGDKPDIKSLKGESNNRKSGPDDTITYKVPDRVTGLETLSELEELYPKRKWNFVKINVSVEELKKERERVIADLIYPLNTVLDDSLGCALWFASRGKGTLHKTNENYTSPSRVLLSGIGADEQLGGYMRHRTTLKHKGGWETLDAELQMELRRISKRNLGRDDRIISSHGRQCRMPFLDEDVINFLNFIPPWYKCYPVESMPPGVGDKLLLRLCAWVLGLRNVSNIPKRAMQFGSRIASSREKGSDVSERL